MKKVFLSITLISFISVATFAQSPRFGITAGVSLASMKAKENGLSVTSDGKVGLTVGLLADVSVAKNLTFQPGVNFTQKGSKFNFSDGGQSMESTQTLNYLELPLNFIYNAPTGSGKFFAGLGPVLGFGVSGKAKSKVTGEAEESGDIKFGSNIDTDQYKPFEFAGNLLAGYEFSNGFFAAANYNMGLSNLAIGSDTDNSSLKNRYFGFKIGYKFGFKK